MFSSYCKLKFVIFGRSAWLVSWACVNLGYIVNAWIHASPPYSDFSYDGKILIDLLGLDFILVSQKNASTLDWG